VGAGHFLVAVGSACAAERPCAAAVTLVGQTTANPARGRIDTVACAPPARPSDSDDVMRRYIDLKQPRNNPKPKE
jgi:hypothetical protein